MNLRSVVRATLAEADPDRAWTDDQVRDVALALQSKLHDAGMTIHALDGRCLRPKGPPIEEIGRPWAEVMADTKTIADGTQGMRRGE